MNNSKTLSFFTSRFVFILPLLLFFSCSETSFAQGDCGDIVADSGGLNGDYANNEFQTFTYCSGTTDQQVTLTFSEFNLESGYDNLDIYLGPDTSSPFYGSYTGSTSPGTVISENGCITIVFNSDGSVTYSGWVAEFNCLTPCQSVVAGLASISVPLDGDDGEALICQGEEITLVGSANYTENNTDYFQEDATSVYEWNFGDGTTGVGQTVSHVFPNEGIYSINLTVTDVMGCSNSNDVSVIIFVSTTPIFEGTEVLYPEICLGEQNILTGVVTPVPYEVICDFVDDPGIVPLPDGNGVSYQSDLDVSCFLPSQTLTNANDLVSICLDIEHSYLGDLQIEIECPSGQSIILLQYPNGGGGTYLGLPIDNNSDPNVSGVGWEYCFTNTPTYGNLSSDLPGTSQPEGNYASDESLAGLIGCELNGIWVIEITDNIGIDNGFLFSWSLDFAPSVIPTDLGFLPEVISENWIPDPTIIATTDSTITVEPLESGLKCYTYQMLDNFECIYDTTICFNVLSASDASFIAEDYCVNEIGIGFPPTIGGGTYSFNPAATDGATIDATTGVITNGIAGTTYGIEYSLDGNCPSSEINEVTLFEPESAEFVLTDFCGGAPNEAVILGTAGGEFSFITEVTNGESINIGTGEITDGVGGETYLVNYTTLGGCPGSSIEEVTVTTQDDASFEMTDFCVNDDNEVDISGTSNGNFSFNPSPGDGATIATMSGTILNAVAETTYSVAYITDGNCPDTANQFVYVIPLDDASFILNDFCGDEENSAQITGVSNGIFSFVDDIIDGATINSETGEISNGIAGAVYAVEYITNDVCPNSSVVDVSVGIEITVNDVQEICEPNQTEYIVSFSIEEGDISTYEVIGGSGVILGNTFTSNAIPSGNNYNFSVMDGNGCNIIEVEGEQTCYCLATAEISGDIIICEGETGILNMNFDGDAPWEFDYTIDGVLQPSVSTFDANYSIPITDNGSYVLTNITDQYCIGATDGLASVEYFEMPTASMAGNYTICSNSSQPIEIILTGNPTWEVIYSLDGIEQLPLSGDSSPILIAGDFEGDYQLVSVEDLNCLAEENTMASISYYPPIDIDIIETQDICIGDEVSILGVASGESESDFFYSWYDGDELISQNTSTVVSPLNSTNYLLEVSSNCGIIFSENVDVVVHEYPVVTFELEQSLLCENDLTTATILNTTNSSMTGNCTWDVNGETFNSCTALTYNFENAGSYDIGLTVVSPYGCSSSAYQPNSVTVNPAPTAQFNYSPDSPTEFNNLVEFENYSEGAITYDWSIDGQHFSTEENPGYELFTIGNHNIFSACLIATNTYGCTDITCSYIELLTELFIYIPTGFSPNNDGINDLFTPVISGGDPLVYEFTVFNKWGEVIFYTEDVTKGWNGTYHGVLNTDLQVNRYYVQNEVYNWVINIKKDDSSEKRNLAGRVTIVR